MVTTNSHLPTRQVQVTVAMPRIDGDRVHFAWAQDAPNHLQTANGFWYRYDGLDLLRFSPELFLEILLAMQLPVWMQQGTVVTVDLPLAMPRGSIDFWRASYRADHVSIAPARPGFHYSPWSGAPYRPWQQQVASHFGAGKDSLAMACMVGEVLGRDQVLLLRSHDPLSNREGVERETRARLRKFSLDPLAERGFAVQEYSTNFSSLAVEGKYDQVRPGYDRFTVASLPALLAHQAEISTLGLTWIDYYHYQKADGSRVPVRHRWRPEGLDALGRHYQRALGFEHRVCDLNMLLVTESSYRLLFGRYPEMVAWLLTCESGGAARWCSRCAKCFSMARGSLANGALAPEFDYERFFTSPYLRQVLQVARDHLDRKPGQNMPYDNREKPLITSKWHYIDLLNAINRIDPVVAIDLLGDQALKNLAHMIRYFGNVYDPRLNVVPQEAIDRLPQPLAGQLAAIVQTVAPVVERIDGPFEIGGTRYHYALGETFPHPMLEVEHVRTIVEGR